MTNDTTIWRDGWHSGVVTLVAVVAVGTVGAVGWCCDCGMVAEEACVAVGAVVPILADGQFWLLGSFPMVIDEAVFQIRTAPSFVDRR